MIVPLFLVAAAAPLLPLTEKQMNVITDYGCNFAFEAGSRTMLYAVNNRMLLRTAAGVRECRPDGDEFNSFSEAEAAVTCGDLALSLRRTGRGRSYPEADSATFPAELSIRRGRERWAIKGTAGTAC